MIHYKIDIMKELSNRGYTRKKLRDNKLLSESTMQGIKHNKNITIETINVICLILRCQPSDIMEVIPTDEEKIKFF